MIMIERGKGASMRSIARTLGRNVSTISREIGRHRDGLEPGSSYDATAAATGYRRRRSRCGRRRRLQEGTPLFQHVFDRLVYGRWSPQQIAHRLRTMHPDDASTWVSHETIYAAIYAHPRGALKQGMIDVLRQGKPARGRRRTSLAKGQTVPEALRIVHRPEAVQQRLLPGHWE
ncbi:MAG: IS30 family transposase, partial [Proteobacteria bacterium]|nr:IS30 family transposase [Pseudomonadota bacterium]